MNQLALLFRLYASPLQAFSRIIDQGRLLFALLAALAVALVLQLPRVAYSGPLLPLGPPSLRLAVDRLTAHFPQSLPPLLALAICFAPLSIFVLTVWDHLGGFTTILFRDYTALLMCCLLAWTAAYLPLILARPIYDHPALWWAAHAYFLVLTVMALRTVFGTRFAHAIGAAAGGWAGSVAGLWLHTIFGGITAYLASPFVLYYLYLALGPELRSLGAGLGSRQRLRRQLEISTLNPRDADAHYQLGLIYQQRRQYTAAIERFRQAIGIDPDQPDAHYQLGRIAREQARYDDALAHLQAAARLDDKHASSEVWREIGITHLLAGDPAAACQALEKYLGRRPYDPEGECWYGRALARQGSTAQARAAFEQAIEAVRTMPPARKRQVRRWESEAKRELKKL